MPDIVNGTLDATNWIHQRYDENLPRPTLEKDHWLMALWLISGYHSNECEMVQGKVLDRVLSLIFDGIIAWDDVLGTKTIEGALMTLATFPALKDRVHAHSLAFHSSI